MTLMVRLDNPAAIGLYRKLGFERERRINAYYDDGAPAWSSRNLDSDRRGTGVWIARARYQRARPPGGVNLRHAPRSVSGLPAWLVGTSESPKGAGGSG